MIHQVRPIEGGTMGWSIHHPVGLIHYSPSRCYRGYTLICTGGGQHAFLLDMEGHIVWESINPYAGRRPSRLAQQTEAGVMPTSIACTPPRGKASA